jgi:hypothetical protein
LGAIYDWRSGATRVRAVLDGALSTLPRTLRFFARYVTWNGSFGSGVAALAGKIGRSRTLFVEPGYPQAIADRSVLVASYFFDAARDEFDDHATPYRDTHRCLAQAMLAGLVEHAVAAGHTEFSNAAHVDTMFKEADWARALRERVATGYGVGSVDDGPAVFRALGYHLGSELLADREFSVIHETLGERQPALAGDLAARQVVIAGQPHRCFQWIEIHSGHGGGAEEDHFQWALQGVALAFRYCSDPPATLLDALHDGYLSFARDHEEFFARVDDGDVA